MINTTLWWLTGLIINIIEFYLLNDFMSTALDKSVTHKKWSVSVYIISIVLLLYANSFQNNILDIGVSITIILLILIILYKGDFLYKVLNIFIFLIPSIVGENLVKLICYSMLDHIDSFSYMLINTMSMLFAFILIKSYLYLVYRQKYIKVYKKWLFLFLLVSVSNFGILISVYSVYSAINTVFAAAMTAITCCAVLLSNTIGFYIFEKLIEQAEDSREKELIIQKSRLEERHYDSLNIKNKEQSFLLHDVRHHMTVIKGLAQKNNDYQVANYISDIYSSYSPKDDIEYTNNPIMNIIINDKSKLAIQKNISFDINIQLCDCSFLTPFQTCTLLSNLLDNAIDAADNFDGLKFIRLAIFPFNPYFITIQLENSCSEISVKRNKLETTKGNSQRHGLGLAHAQSIVEDLNGTLEWNYYANVFSVSVILNIVNTSDGVVKY